MDAMTLMHKLENDPAEIAFEATVRGTVEARVDGFYYTEWPTKAECVAFVAAREADGTLASARRNWAAMLRVGEAPFWL